MPRLFVLTPLRDEAENIPELVATLRAQTRPVDAWIVLENGSTDGSRALLADLRPEGALASIDVRSLELEQREYALGRKYSSIVDMGLAHLTATHRLADEDMVALLDADSFVDPDYYAVLEAAFAADPRLGMACGRAIRPGKSETETRWTGGGYFVWRYACLREAGYVVGPSADVVSSTKAHLKGWKREVVPATRVRTRGQGQRVDHSYYGKSAYFRGETVLHCLALSAKRIATGQVRAGVAHASGYLGELARGAPRTEDAEIRAYFRSAVGRRVREILTEKRGA